MYKEVRAVPKMVRKQVYITQEQDRMLKRRAQELGTTESELIRQGINQISRATARRMFDQQAWEEELAFMAERAKLPHSGQPRTWTREELYDE